MKPAAPQSQRRAARMRTVADVRIVVFMPGVKAEWHRHPARMPKLEAVPSLTPKSVQRDYALNEACQRSSRYHAEGGGQIEIHSNSSWLSPTGLFYRLPLNYSAIVVLRSLRYGPNGQQKNGNLVYLVAPGRRNAQCSSITAINHPVESLRRRNRTDLRGTMRRRSCLPEISKSGQKKEIS